MNAIFKRRSVRSYKSGKIEAEMMRKILGAAMSAPSTGNQKPWHFIVVDNKELLAELSNISPYSGMLKNAAAAIIVCADLELEKFKGYWVQDCSAATQNILTEIEELELGGVWLGVYPEQDRVEYIQQMFKLNKNIFPLSIISIGYPEKKSEVMDRYDEGRVHNNKW